MVKKRRERPMVVIFNPKKKVNWLSLFFWVFVPAIMGYWIFYGEET